MKYPPFSQRTGPWAPTVLLWLHARVEGSWNLLFLLWSEALPTHSQICLPFHVGVLTHVLPPPNLFTWTLRPHPFLTTERLCHGRAIASFHRRRRGRKLHHSPIRMDCWRPSLSYTFSVSYFFSSNDALGKHNCLFRISPPRWMRLAT